MREPEGYRCQLERLATVFPGREVLSIQDVTKLFNCHRQTLLADNTFPAKQIGGKGKYYVSLSCLAWWMSKR